MTVKPEKELKVIWYMTAFIVFAVTAVILLTFYLFTDVNPKVIAGFSVAWLLSLVITLIWIPAAYRAVEYYIEDDSVKMKGGIFWRKQVTVPNQKITNIDITQGPFQRFLKLGTIHVQTAGAGGQQGQKAELKISGVRDTGKIKDAISENIASITPAFLKEKERGSLPSYQQVAKTGFSSEREVLADILEILKSIDERLKK